MEHLEQAFFSFRDIQNFLFWLMGIFVTLMSDNEGLPKGGPMLQQVVLSIQRAIVDQARVTAFAVTNTRAGRRESYLSHLPHHFTSASKAQLHRSDMDSDLLFNVDSIDKAVGQAQQVSSVSFTEAACSCQTEA